MTDLIPVTRDEPTPAVDAGLVTGLLIAALALYNIAQNLLLPNWSYAVLNTLLAAGIVAGGLRLGLSSRSLGVERAKLWSGIVRGAGVAGALIVVIAVAMTIPALRPLLEDSRVTTVGTAGALYEMAVRIPLGTALFEEVVFRGLVLGWFMSRTTTVRAVVWSSALFGLWHVLPTWEALDLYQTGAIRMAGTGTAAGAIVAAVALTGLAGAAFSVLRLWTTSIATPVVVHAAINSFVYGAFFFAAAS